MNDPAYRRPIAAHPAFPAAAALWLGAFFGLALLVLPDWLLDGLARKSGLAAIAPGLAPPLDRGEHLIASLVAALLGAAIGFAVAWPIARKARGTAMPLEEEEAQEPVLAEPASTAPLPRLLRIREELEADFAAEAVEGADTAPRESFAEQAGPIAAKRLDALKKLELRPLVARFDRALDRATAAIPPAQDAKGSPIDHQEHLRTALNKLAHMRQREGP